MYELRGGGGDFRGSREEIDWMRFWCWASIAGILSIFWYGVYSLFLNMMPKIVKACGMALLVAVLAAPMAQAQSLAVNFQWDASSDDAAAAGTVNPIKYRLKVSPNADLSLPAVVESDRALTASVTIPVGVVYVYATAYRYALVNDTPTGPELESGPSNVLKLEVFAPPGRPDKVRLKSVTTVAESQSGSTVKMAVKE